MPAKTFAINLISRGLASYHRGVYSRPPRLSGSGSADLWRDRDEARDILGVPYGVP